MFHISQIENVLPLEKEERFDTEPIEQAETVLQDYIEREQIGLELVDGGNQAYYSPSADRIVLPALNQFRRAEEFYSTAFHEASHSTLKRGDATEKQRTWEHILGMISTVKRNL